MQVTTLIILGSGMSGCFTDDEIEIVDDDATSNVAGHRGVLAMLRDAEPAVLLALGRRHLYEGYTLADVQATVVRAASLGARNLIVTNAAGGLNPRFAIGDIMLIEDAIATMLGRWIVPALTASNNIERSGAMRPFATELYEAITASAMEHGIGLQRGVYAGVPGPSYETRAEIRMLRRMGADAVGMSTVAEVAAANQAPMRVVGLSLITNTLTDTVRATLSHEDVVEQGRLATEGMRHVIDAVLEICRH